MNFIEGVRLVRDAAGKVCLEEKIPFPRTPELNDQVIYENIYGTVCNADIRAATGEKKIVSSERVVVGHEGVCRVVGVGAEVRDIRAGDIAVLKPHLWDESRRPSDGRDETQMGRGATKHLGFEIDGPFAHFGRLPARQLAVLSPTRLSEVQRQVELCPESKIALNPEAYFCVAEPIACCLTGLQVLKEHCSYFFPQTGPMTTPKRVLVVGSGAIGTLFGLVMLAEGWQVDLHDTQDARVAASHFALSAYDALRARPYTGGSDYDVVIVCTNFASAVKFAEIKIRDGGAIYLMAGFNSADYDAVTCSGIAVLETIHRLSEPALLRVTGHSGSKTVLYSGHSGYRDNVQFNTFEEAIDLVEQTAHVIDRILTSVAQGLKARKLRGRFGKSRTPDYVCAPRDRSALASVLTGRAENTTGLSMWNARNLKLIVDISATEKDQISLENG
jgi:threonine dehydrogenase-like Zn-dependent dehydrogenase